MTVYVLPSLVQILDMDTPAEQKLFCLDLLRDRAVDLSDQAIVADRLNAADRCCRWVEQIDLARAVYETIIEGS